MYVFCLPYHAFVPDDGQPLLGSIGTFWDHGEVVFAHGTLRGVESAVSTTGDLQVPTGEMTFKEVTC